MFDVLTMAAIADELSGTIVGGRIQRIGLVDRLTVAMEVYAERRRRWLVLSADSQRGRVMLGDQAVSLDPALITPFGLLLRKYLRGATIVAVENPPWNGSSASASASVCCPSATRGSRGPGSSTIPAGQVRG